MTDADRASVPARSPPPSRRLPMHDPAIRAQSIDNARDFYNYDQRLNKEDRQRLASFFWQKTTLYPALGLPILWGFIQSPNWLKRRGFIPANRSYRFAQLALGFIGLFAGLQFGMGIGTFIQLKQLQSNPAAQQAYALLSLYPPQLGSRYFSMTAKNPELALQNPDAIDWDNNPLFPFCLIMNRQIIGEWKRQDQNRIDRYKAAEQQRNAEKMRRIEASGGANSENSSQEPTGTSWDNVIARSNSQHQSPVSTDSQDSLPNARQETPVTPTQPPLRKLPASNARKPVPPQEQGTDSLIDGISVNESDFTGDLNEDQRRFDELLERERQGTYVDDFSASEKKW